MELICSQCGARAPVNTRDACCSCGGLWDLDFKPPTFSLDRINRDCWSLFRYRAFLPLLDDSWRSITLGEGMTPIISWNSQVLLKLDYCMPTLSFKDRGAAVLISHCKSIGVSQVVQDSSGNAGNSIAAYCGRAGIACQIFVPEGTSPRKIQMIRAHGATCTVVPGSRDHCADVCRAQVAQQGAYYASHVYQPFFYQGTKTYLYEVYEQLHRIPRCLVLPVGNGTLLFGVLYALRELMDAGCIDVLPRILAVQSEGCAPLLQAARAQQERPAEVVPRATLAEGIAIGRPMRGAQLLRLAKEFSVEFIAAPEQDILSAQAALAARGLYCEPTTAASLAAFEHYCAQNGPIEDCLIPLCGAGLKAEH